MPFKKKTKSLRIRIYCFLLGCMFLSSEIKAENNLGYGPFEMGDLFPLSQFHLTLFPESPSINNNSSGELFSRLGWTNTVTWERGAYRTDAELEKLLLGGKYSITDSLEISITTVLEWQDGGITDHFIYEWHDTFGLPQGDRNNPAIKDNSFNLNGRNQDGSSFKIKDKGFNFGDITLGAKYLLSEGATAAPTFAISSFLRLPTATDYYQQDAIDIGANLLGAKRFSDFVIYSGIGYVFIGDDFEQGVKFKHHQGFAFLTLEYDLYESLGLIVTYSGYTSAIDELKKFPDYQTYLDFGVKAGAFDNSTFEIAVRENPFPTHGTADISLILGYKIGFSGK